jgi:formate-dependent phosphoribosylglycinamide formyltransferase (GAR transformylase)
MSSSGKGQSTIKNRSGYRKSMELCRGRFRGDVVEVIVEAFVKFNRNAPRQSDTAAIGPTRPGCQQPVQVQDMAEAWPFDLMMYFSELSPRPMIPEW